VKVPGLAPVVFQSNVGVVLQSRTTRQPAPGGSSQTWNSADVQPAAVAVHVTDVPATCGLARLGVKADELHGEPSAVAVSTYATST